MLRSLLLTASLATVAFAQSTPLNLSFEEGQPGEIPTAWFGPKPTSGYALRLTHDHPKAGDSCAEMDFIGSEHPAAWGSMGQTFDGAPYRGKRVRFRAAVKVSGDGDNHAQMWFRVDRPDHATGFFENMDDRPIRVAEWQYFDITGDVDDDAGRITIGLMLFGKGKAWIDDASVEILGDTPVTPSYAIPPSAALDKLTEAAKLWVYVKYLNTRVTMPGVDWDQAFMDAVPKILESKNDDDFAVAVNAMLAPLHDPYTRALNPAAEKEDNRIVLAIHPGPQDVLVIGLTAGDEHQAQQARQSAMRELASAKAVVFDVRGSRSPSRNFAALLSFTYDAPSTLKRIHSGYANQNAQGYEGYHSAWQIEDGEHVKKPHSTSFRPVFLVDKDTIIPDIAVASQDSGRCAIISEDTITDAQTRIGEHLKTGNLDVWVRTREYEHSDGTSGFTANVVLNKTGDAALQDAIAFARSGNWPAPLPRSRFSRPPAVFTEKTSPKLYPPTQMRLLAAARIWGVFNYFHPYKYLYGEDWDAVFAEFLPRLGAAKNAREYHLAVAEMVTHVHDGHCSAYSTELMTAFGPARSSVEVRWIENQPVVTRIADPELAKTIHPGDVVTKIKGEPVQKRIDQLSPFIGASTTQALMQRVMSFLLSGTGGEVIPVAFRGADGVEHEVALRRATEGNLVPYPPRSGEVFRLLNPKIGYVDLERLPIAQVDAMFDTFQNTDAIIMDMRGYPQGTAWSIAPRLATSQGMPNAQFRTNILTTGGEQLIASELFEQRIPVTSKPRYKGKTVMLIDDRAISQSEHSGLMYKTANGTVFIGSPTDGANGDVTGFTAPGGIRISFSGHDVRWPDGKQLQRVGLIPDVEAHPTIEGIRAGRDEILDRALSYLETGR